MLKKVFFKGSIFIIILLLIVSELTSIFILKTNHREKLLQGLYDNVSDPMDVVLLGSSHMNSGINPNVLWNQYGITSFNYATGGQPIDVTYYLLKEVLKTHKNPIVVVDLYYLGLTNKFGDDGYVSNVLDNLKFSTNKINAIINSTPIKQWPSYFFPIFKYHGRYKELTENDFDFDPVISYYQKGFDAGLDYYEKENTSDPLTSEISDIPPKSEKYLNKIITLSKEQGFKLIFTNTPQDYNETKGSSSWVKDPAKMFNKIAEISKNNNIPFINYPNMINELEFDFKTDMFNAGHLNISGSNKVTLNFGKFLKENYALVDHRNDVGYKEWNSDYIYYTHMESQATLTREIDIKDYSTLLENKNYIIVVSSNDDGISKNVTLKDAFAQLGLKINEQNNVGSNYLAVINDNKVESEILSSSKLSKEFTLGKDINLKITTESDDKNMPSISFNGVESLNNHNGINIAVYDKLFKKVVDAIYLDSNNVIKR